jgi:hypothetical protein
MIKTIICDEGEDGAEPVQEYDVTKSIVMQ